MVTDIFDIHDYDQNPETFKERYDAAWKSGEIVEWNGNCRKRQKWDGKQPLFVSEYGGIKYKKRFLERKVRGL